MVMIPSANRTSGRITGDSLTPTGLARKRSMEPATPGAGRETGRLDEGPVAM